MSEIEDDFILGEPVVERITQNIVTALKELTTNAGLSANAVVHRPNPAKPPAVVDFGMTVVQGDPEADDEIETTDGLKGWIQPYLIACDVVLPEDKITPIDRALNRIRSAVENKLREDPRRGGLAVDTVIMPPELSDTAEQARMGTVTVVAHVHYRTLEDDDTQTPGELDTED